MPFVLVLALLLAVPPVQGADRPLPEPQSFLREVRARLQTDEDRQRDYIYVQTQKRMKLDGAGRATGVSVRVSESYPGLPGERRWERLLVDDGRRLSASELRKQDAERQKKAEEYARKVSRQSEAERAREQAKEQRAINERIEDVFRAFEIAMVRREAIGGHDTIVFSLTPRPKAVTKSPEGKWLRYFQGRVWISETDYELVRLEVEAVKDVSVGMGLMARVHKGTRAAFERTKVNGERWLPARADYTVSGRILLLRRLREGGTAEFSDYRKFGVSTDTTYGKPVTPKSPPG